MRRLILALGALAALCGPATAQFGTQLSPPPCAYTQCTVQTLTALGLSKAVVTSQSQASGGSTLLAFVTTSGLSAGQVVGGTSIPLGDTIASIVSTAEVTRATTSGSSSGQKLVNFTSTTGFGVGQQCTDTTAPSAIGAGNVIASIQANVSITMTTNLTGNAGSGDTIVCDPVVTLTTTSSGTIGAAASILFIPNATSLSASSAIYDAGDMGVAGNVNIGGVGRVQGQGSSTGIIVGSDQTGPLKIYQNAANQMGITGAGTSAIVSIIANSNAQRIDIAANNGGSYGIISNWASGAIAFSFGAGAFQWQVSTAGTLSNIAGTGSLTASGTITFAGVTTGTNADFVCMAAGGVLTLQTSACTISSLRFKENVNPFSGAALAEVSKLTTWTYNLKATKPVNPDPNARALQIGLTAENVAKVDPRCAIYENDMKTPKSYRQECVIALLVKAVQEQQTQIAALIRRPRK